jgi:ATP-dependent Clp protease ATP-binding subunit ClpC
MTSGFFPGGYGSPFDDFFARYMAGGGGPRQPRQRIDITQFLSERARELVNTAARRAAETGSADLDTDHLLWAMTEEQATQHLLGRAGVNPGQLRQQLDGMPSRGEPRSDPPPSPRLPNGPCSTRTRSPGRSGPPTSAPSTCCSRSR